MPSPCARTHCPSLPRILLAGCAVFFLTGSALLPQPAAARAFSHRPASQQTVVHMASCGSAIYVVRAGDTMASIARRYGTTGYRIMVCNRMSAARLYAGLRLVIPARYGG